MLRIYMPASAVLISIILLVVYMTKEKADIKENEVYQIMLICILIDSICCAVIFATAGPGESISLKRILNRIDYMMLLMWSSCLCGYTHAVLHKKDNDGRYPIFQKRRRIITRVAHVEVILAWVLPMYITFEDGIATTVYGPVVIATLVGCAVNLVWCLTIIVMNIKKVTTQVAPVFIFLGIAVLCTVFYCIDPGISGVSMGLTIVNMTMYFTIENPDVQMLEQVNIAREQAQRASQAKTDFLSSMSHEIRTPINAIMGLAECIGNDETLGAAQADAKDIIMASENLLEIVNGILDISKIEAGKMEIVNKEYDLVDVSENLTKLIKARIGEKQIELRPSFSREIPGVLYGDETKVRQIMTNLLTNAVKYTEKGHIDFSIDSENKDDVANLIISVKDTGQGIKEEVIGKLFDRFKRIDEDRNSGIEGTGLGLAITKQFVEMMNGSVEVSSVFGEGSTFTVRIPQEIRSMDRKAKEQVVDAHREYPGHRMLVVDDVAINLTVAKRLLKQYKIEVDTANSGEECVEKCKTEKYDLVLLDDMMPNMTGPETLVKLKEIPSFDMTVIAFTANAIDGMKEKYLEDGFSDYMSKPIIKSELVQVLDRYFV